MSETARSITRTAALLDLFERERRALTSGEIVSELDVPRSSLAALLKALVQLGWLTIDRRSATYFPAAKLARTTSWLLADALVERRVQEAVGVVSATTQETVTVCCVQDLHIEVALAKPAKSSLQLIMREGERIPMWGSAIGTAYLSSLPEATIRSLYERSTRAGSELRPRLTQADALRLAREARNRGFAYVASAIMEGVGAYAVALPIDAGPRPLVVGVGGPQDRVEQRAALIQRALRNMIASLTRAPARAASRVARAKPQPKNAATRRRP